jgi:hypothetical protein
MIRSIQRKRISIVAAVLFVIGVGCFAVGTVAAAPQETTTKESPDEESDEPTIDIDLDGITDAIDDLADDFDDFTDNWTEDLADVIKQVIFEPFRALAEVLVDILTHALTSYPDVGSNSDVRSLHSLSFRITLAAGGVVVAAAGILYMIGPVFGIGYAQVRTLLPRIIVAVMFGAVSTTLLQYSVDMAEAVTYAFQPANPTLASSLRLTGELVLVAVLESMLLLGLVLVFLIRDFYILFAAAIAPLIALGWSFPYAKKYADSMIGTYWAALLIGPVDMVLFRFTLSLLETEGGGTPHWLLAAAGILVMIWMPYQMYGASQAAGSGFRRMMSGAKRKVRNERRRQRQPGSDTTDREPQNRRGQSGERARSNSDYLWSGNDD